MKTLAKKVFLLLLLFLVTSNSLEIPDFVEEDGMINASFMNDNTEKSGDDNDDKMSDDTSSSDDGDKEMIETADTPHDDNDGMGDDGDDTKTVEKSKIQHNSSHSKTDSNGEDADQMESRDDEDNDDDDDDEEDDDGSNVKEKSDEKGSEPSKNQEDSKNNEDLIKSSENTDSDDEEGKTSDHAEDETESNKKNYLSEVKEKDDVKEKEDLPSKTNAAKDVKNTSSDKKTHIKDNKDNENEKDKPMPSDSITNKDVENPESKKDDNADNGTVDKPKIATIENTDNKNTDTPTANEHNTDTERLKAATSDNNNDIAKSKPTININPENEDSQNQELKLKENKEINKAEIKTTDNDNNNNNANKNSNGNNNPKLTTDADKPKLITDDKIVNDESKKQQSTTKTDNIENEDTQNPKSEGDTANKDSDKPTTKMDKIKTQDTVNPAQATSDNPTNGNSDTTDPKSNDNDVKTTNVEEKPYSISSIAKENNLDETKQTTEKPEGDINVNKDNGSPNTEKASDVGKSIEVKSEKEQVNNGEDTPKDSLAKDNEEPSPDKSDNSNMKLKENDIQEEALPKDDDKNAQKIDNEPKATETPTKSSNDHDEGDHGNNNGHDEDIRGKVEQLSMNTGDESEEEGGKLGSTEAKSDGHQGTTGGNHKITEVITETSEDRINSNTGKYNTVKEPSVSPGKPQETGENHNASPDQENQDKSQQIQGDTSSDKTTGPMTKSVNKEDVVNTLVASVSGNEKAGSASVSAQTSGNNFEENLEDQKVDGLSQDNNNVKGLLNDLVPSGILPNLPEGFGKLSEMSTVSFTYNVQENNDVIVTSDIKEPMELFHGKLEISNAKVVFSYNNKYKTGQKWQFKAQGIWINGEQEIDVILENSKHDHHFTLTGKGDSLALHDYSSMFATQETFIKSGMSMDIFEEIMLSDIELYVVFKDFENIVSLVSGDVKINRQTQPSRCQTFIEKFPKKDPVFAILLDFDNSSPHSVLSSVMAEKTANIPYVKELLNDKGLLKVADGGFGFAASSEDVKKLKLNVFGEGMLERELGSHISSGVTLTLPMSFHSHNNIEKHDIIMKISHTDISIFPTKGEILDLGKVFKTLSEFTRPKISSLGYPDVTNVLLRELRYDLNKLTYTALGYSTSPFNAAPGMLNIEDATLEFQQMVPDEFATLALYGSGTTNIGQSKVNISLHTDTTAGELILEGTAHTLWSADVASSFGVNMEIDDDVKKILEDNRMLNFNIEKPRMFATVKDGRSGTVHVSGYSRPISWNDAIQVEAVVFHDLQTNKKRMALGYLFKKLPLTYAIDAFSFNRFPTPRLLDNSRNTSLVLSPVNTESLFLNQAFNGLSFMRGLSLVGQFRLPDVCSLNVQCEAAAQLLGTEKWYRVQGLVSSRGYTLAGYVDKDFNLAKGLKLSDNILEFVLGNYSYMSISTAMRLDKNNLSFSGYVNFDTNGVRLRMSSDNIWSHPFPGDFLTFDRLQIDVPLISGIAMDELLVTGNLNFGLRGSLYRIYAPAYLTFTPSKPKDVGFQATLANLTLETLTSALNFKSSLPGVLLDSRFPDTLVARYTPTGKKDENLEFYGKLDILSRTVICKLRIDNNKHITATTSHSKYPLILDDGLITVYADKHRTRLGPRVWFTVTPEITKFKLEGFANFMGLGTKTKIDVSEYGTEFDLTGNLFGVTKTVVSFMSPDSLPESGPYFASACLPDIIPKVISHVNLLLASAADQAERYMKQASENYNQATMYHKQALADEQKHILMLDDREEEIESDDREMFLAEERYNRTCKEEQCGKTCIGCTSWLKCCDHDVFGNCVKCPGWKPCCWHGKSPICKAKNHACRIIKQVAAENLQKIARRVYSDKEKKRAKEKILWQSEYMKGKTQAVVDAARRAVHLVNHDSKVGLGAAATIKRFGLERLVNIKTVCFHTTLKTLASSCVAMRINATFADEEEVKSLPYYGCLNRELVPKMATHIAHVMFQDKEKVVSKQAESRPKAGRRRSGHTAGLFGKPLEEDQVDLTSVGTTYMRRRREYDSNDDDMDSRPFWLIRNSYQPHVPSLLQQRTTVPRSPLKKKWQIPASKKGKCKVYRQLVEICKDMMATVKKMFESYEDSKDNYHKRRIELQLGINTTIYDLEKQVLEAPELRDRLPDIEMNIRTVGAGVTQWQLNCEADQEDQNKVAIQEWVSTMEGRIRKLGGQGVDRFLSNLFRAFEGMFLGAETPKHSAQKVLNTLQSIREISATFHDIFGNNEITLEKANSRAEIVMAQLKQIKNAQMFCDD